MMMRPVAIPRYNRYTRHQRQEIGREVRVSALSRSWLVVAAASLTAVVLAGPSEELADKINAAIAALSSPRLAERQTAERQLTELGPEALPHLPPPDLIDSAAAREALRRVRLHLERQAAEESLKPIRIDARGELSPADLLKRLEHEAHVTIQTSEQLPGLQSLRVFAKEAQPFWRLLDAAAVKAGGHWEFSADSNSLQIQPTDLDSERFPSATAWRTSPESFVIRVLSIENRPLKSDRLLRFHLGIAAEPRLRPLLFNFAARDVAATAAPDDVVLEWWNPAARYEIAAGTAGREWPLTAEYILPRENHSNTASIKGEIHTLVATGRQSIEFNDWWKGRRTWLRRGGATATLGRVRISRAANGADSAEVDLTLTYDTEAPPLESHQRWVLHQAASLRTTDGKIIPFTRSEVSEEQSSGMSVRYTFERIPDTRQTVLIYEPATALLSVPLRFELQGLPIPARQ